MSRCVGSFRRLVSPLQMEMAYLPLGMWRICGCQPLEHPPENKGSKEGDGTTSTSNAKPVTPFIMGESLPPIPAKLVMKIQKGEFVDMAELLRDNIEAERRRTKEGGTGG